jgi:hypothetical protein
MSEFVKKGGKLIEGKKRWTGSCGPGEIGDKRYERPYGRTVINTLIPETCHPRSSAFPWPGWKSRKRMAMNLLSLPLLPRCYFVVINRYRFVFGKGEAKQFSCEAENSFPYA